MLDRISSFDERLLYVGITIVVKANSIEELEERTEKIKIIGQTHNMDIVPHSHKQLDALNTSLPTGARFVDTMRTITSEELSIFIPFMCRRLTIIRDTAMDLIRCPKTLSLKPEVIEEWERDGVWCPRFGKIL